MPTDSDEPSTDSIRRELQAVARDEGLTAAKLEHSELAGLIVRRVDWSPSDFGGAFYELICETVGQLREEKLRLAAQAALGLGDGQFPGRTLSLRQKELAASKGVHGDTVRDWWRDAATRIAERLVVLVADLNQNPGDWDRYRSDRPTGTIEAGTRPNFSLSRVDVAWRLVGKVGRELVSYRSLVAHADGIDRYSVQSWYYSDPRHSAYRVHPLLNCALGESTAMPRGILLTDLLLPETLMKGDRVFFAYRVEIDSDRAAEPIFLHEVRAASVERLIFRVQFDPDMLPGLVWSFAARGELEPFTLPPDGSSRYLRPSRLGYVEREFTNCAYGGKYGISWRWVE
ncbi:hypothetical protein I6A60_39155 [Frankia sp. AgB1.9]|uniref:hypothetical protein n=1 Tax=unclassified Frankia TaxID=2632575 RepID=UPI0019329727|nr:MULTISPECIES: hypothetical protein [unclassified Frankia]MBL7491555.1 hypothetical protein [Frankia sp. AgW1.1]MBL7553804.1 hypothetical protein [Frankia sp. AgB1.9]MBL7617904.1 hypothetical protein [Frankia sp. AgB1.8]